MGHRAPTACRTNTPKASRPYVRAFLSAVSYGNVRAFTDIVKRHILLALALIVCRPPLQCATLERLSLADMINQSHAIVRAKVLSSYASFSGPVIYTHYKLQVSEQYKSAAAPVVEVLVPGGVANNTRQVFAGAPGFQPGDEYVFFLWTSRAGLTQVIGLTQGLFAVAQDGSKDPGLTRPASQELMLEHSTGRAVKDQKLTMRLSDLKSQIASTLASTTVSLGASR
jgi:hypothetical protein